MDWKYKTLCELMHAFPGGFLNDKQEFIVDAKRNKYFIFGSCSSLLEVQCSVIAWLSRSASKGQPYKTAKKNEEYQAKIRDGINTFLSAEFSKDDMEVIYTKLGNNINRDLCIKFIQSGYDLSVLNRGERYVI